MTATADIGLIGLAVMGENLVLNMESRGNTVAVYNRTHARVDDFLAGRAKGKRIVGCHSVKELVAALKRPRKVMMMVKAGPAVDQVIEEVAPLLEPGDILIDGGNTHYPDTTRRTKALEGERSPFHRHRRFRRRGRGAARPIDHAGRRSRGLAARQADLSGHRGQGARRHALL